MVDRVAPHPRAAGCWGMVALIVALEVFVGARREFADPVALEWRGGAKAIQSRSRPTDVICLGDSLIKHGIAAPVLAARLGCSVRNFAVPAAPASSSYFALKHAIEAGARPRLVLVSYAPFLLLPGYRLNRQYLPETATAADSLDLAWAARDPGLGGALLLGQLVPTVRNRVYLRTRIARVTGTMATGPNTPAGRHDLWLPGGNQAVFDWFYPTAWKPGDDHRRYVERLIDLAEGHGATVVWLIPPLGDAIRAEWQARGLDARYTRFAAGVQERFPRLVVIDARTFPLDESDRADPLHLTQQGAERFTAEVAEVLADLPQQPRWIGLSSPATAVGRFDPACLTDF